MRQIRTEIAIAASSDRVWEVLSDLARYPEWNPFVTEAKGPLTPGASLRVVLKPEGGRPMAFRPMVLQADPGRALRWRGRLALRGLFDGEHSFAISSLPDGTVQFEQSERFSGILVPLVMRRRMTEATRRGFEAMNLALKARAEQRPDG